MYAEPRNSFTQSRLPDPIRRPDFYAGVTGKRFAAWLVDMVLIGIVCVLLLPFTAFTGIFFFPLMMLFVGFLYRWGTIAAGSGTWGMRLMGMELREADGHRLSNATAFAHTLGYTISIAFPILQAISIVLMLISDRKQGLTDHILGTALLNRPAV
ncbi:RDD family protein [Histidinibacterium aquaticum]|uniref:RDD family protein n=1 Tax=Histidinibacterium aquaticum TaxID=2613962 RepID=A0A5J5GK90_9RHOB|nr:RDD family protein [Histidinibacterium aquaticum]KAA9008736.1 RDD family protein [Histidinibacterium aquaticum]